MGDNDRKWWAGLLQKHPGEWEAVLAVLEACELEGKKPKASLDNNDYVALFVKDVTDAGFTAKQIVEAVHAIRRGTTYFPFANEFVSILRQFHGKHDSHSLITDPVYVKDEGGEWRLGSKRLQDKLGRTDYVLPGVYEEQRALELNERAKALPSSVQEERPVAAPMTDEEERERREYLQAQAKMIRKGLDGG